MKCLLFILTCLPLLAQDPAALMAMNPVLYPSNVSGCVTWVKADFGVNRDLLGHACADGESVAEWVDTSGTGHSFQPWNFGVAPKYRANLINGIGGVDFTGGTSVVLSNSFSVGYGSGFVTNPTTAFVLFYVTNFVNTFDNRVVSDWNATQTFRGGVSPAGVQIIQTTGGASTAQWNGPESKKWHVATVAFENNPSMNRLYFDSKLVAQSLGADGAGYTGIGLALYGESVPLQGYISEVILYNRHLNDTERYGIEMYLKRKYALPDPF